MYLEYDPNYHYDDCDDGDDISKQVLNGNMAVDDDYSGDEEEDQEYSDDEDMSWKVSLNQWSS